MNLYLFACVCVCVCVYVFKLTEHTLTQTESAGESCSQFKLLCGVYVCVVPALPPNTAGVFFVSSAHRREKRARVRALINLNSGSEEPSGGGGESQAPTSAR